MTEATLNLVRAKKKSDESAAPVRAEKLLSGLETFWLRLDRLTEKFLPPALNPFGQLGAIANTCFLVALVSGIALLIWYSPSVHQAYASLEKLREGAWLGQWMRSLHRYSSDGCILFILLHTARIVCQRRFGGARWLAWGAGIFMLAVMWFIGWSGYWLVWDVGAQHAALGTAKFLDSLGVFAEPMARAFLTDEGVPSLLFFLIFFTHMLLPLAIGIGLWLHLTRLNRSRLLTGRAMTWWICGSLAAVSALLPALSGAAAQMTVKSQGFAIDWWYLWPLALTDRLGGGALWAVFLFAGLVTFTVPWWMARRTPAQWKAEVDLSRCFGCTLCAKDCPFAAITMVAREDDRKFEVQSHVNPDLCVGCGVCVGACDSQAINLPAYASRTVESDLNTWIDAVKARGEKPYLIYGCGESAVTTLRLNADGSSPEMSNCRIENVPCIGWVSAVMLERPLKRGVEGIIVVGCGETDPVARDGCQLFEHRLEGNRQPAFNKKEADANRVRLVHLDRSKTVSVRKLVHEFRPPAKRRDRFYAASAGIVLAVMLGGTAWLASALPYRTLHSSAPELVVSFVHQGDPLGSRKLTKEELDKLLPHMRTQVSLTRERVPVRLRVTVDGVIVHDQAYRPRGLAKDGSSLAIVRLPEQPGTHTVSVQLADTTDPERWTQSWEQNIEFRENHISVVMFDTKTGFVLR
jgi:ferredoxin/coenzyme F420-reducing hydrogenase delta subunit